MPSAPRFAFILSLGLILPATTGLAADPPAQPRPFTIRVVAGAHDRRDSLVTFDVPPARLDPDQVRTLQVRPIGLLVYARGGGTGSRSVSVAEARRRPDGTIEATWFLAEPIPAGGEARFEVRGGTASGDVESPWTATATPGKEIRIGRRPGRPVFTYNAGPTTPPAAITNPDMIRGAYIHPAFSPAGTLVTGDFSPFHPHHRGFFLAYTHTRWGDIEPDFWNIQNGSGRIVPDGFDPPTLGPVACLFSVRHRWEARRATPTGTDDALALRERWDIATYDVPGSACWLVDLTATQQAVGHPLELVPHRYGGMAFRSAEPSVNAVLDVLTAEGRHRFDGDQKKTRWVDLTGPIAAGSPNYAGALIADHPSNPRYPNVARIHPVTLPFFSFVPGHDESFLIGIDRPTLFRYRIMIHDGRPDPALNDRVAADFANPPVVTVLD